MVGGPAGREEEAAVRLSNLNPAGMSPTSIHGSFYHLFENRLVWIQDFCCTRTGLFGCLSVLRSIPGLYEHVFFCITTFAPHGPLGGSSRRRAGVLCLFLLRFGSRLFFYEVSMACLLLFRPMLAGTCCLSARMGQCPCDSASFTRL